MSSCTGPVVGLVILSLVFIHGVLAQQDHGPSSTNDRRELIGAALNGDDFHTNVDLSKMMDAHRYNLISGLEATSDETSEPTFESLANKLMPKSAYARSQYNGAKWPQYRPISVAKEDKDYTFVMLPTINDNDRRINQDLASRASLWATDILPALLATQNRLRNLGQPPVAYGRHGSADVNSATGPNREKRRRCKVDPNLGVKNPSFCETDAFFGATEYGRDVWDSAGR